VEVRLQGYDVEYCDEYDIGMEAAQDGNFYRATDVDALLASMAAGPWKKYDDNPPSREGFILVVFGEFRLVTLARWDENCACWREAYSGSYISGIIAYAEINPPEPTP